MVPFQVLRVTNVIGVNKSSYHHRFWLSVWGIICPFSLYLRWICVQRSQLCVWLLFSALHVLTLICSCSDELMAVLCSHVHVATSFSCQVFDEALLETCCHGVVNVASPCLLVGRGADYFSLIQSWHHCLLIHPFIYWTIPTVSFITKLSQFFFALVPKQFLLQASNWERL